jgi:hypothetical protein
MRYPSDLDDSAVDHPSKAAHQLREGDGETLGQLLYGRQTDIQVAAFGLLMSRILDEHLETAKWVHDDLVGRKTGNPVRSTVRSR